MHPTLLPQMKPLADISEDEISGLEDQVQKMTDKYIAEVDKAVEAKTKEILTV